jgi:Domain of unknown function (DUF4129)
LVDVPPLRLPPSVHPAGQVHRVTAAVLSRREFREPRPSLLAQLRQRLLDVLGRLIARVLDGAHGSLIGWLVVAALVTVVVLLLARFAAGVSRDPGLPGLDHLAADVRTGAEWRAEAAGHEAAGRWRQAVRCHYRALVADLAARGLVDEVPGRTAGEYRAEVTASAPTAAADFGGATELFERAWYGNRPTGPDEAERLRHLAGRVLEGAAR